MIKLTAAELHELANLLAPAVAAAVAEEVIARLPPHVCPFSLEDRIFLVGLSLGARQVRKTALATVVGFVVIALLGGLVIGLVEWTRRTLNLPAGSVPVTPPGVGP